ncbi:MAG: glycoside hydrolase family 10 protein [Prochlorotrichaceae cyanobacterium]
MPGTPWENSGENRSVGLGPDLGTGRARSPRFPRLCLRTKTIATLSLILSSSLGAATSLASVNGAGNDLSGNRGSASAHQSSRQDVLMAEAGRLPDSIDLAQRRSEQAVLGVLYSENPQWANAGQRPSQVQQALREQLEKTGIPFRLLPLNTLTDASTLNRYSFLFLVNAAQISEAESIGLENWLQRGGRLLLSGPIATESSQSVRQSLRRTLGVYWETYTDRPQLPRIQSTQPWVPRDTSFPALGGGILVPTRPESQVLVTWQSTQEAAVVANDRLVFLGWSWGEQQETENIDQAWLAASLERFHNFPAVPQVQPPPSAPPAVTAAPNRTAVPPRPTPQPPRAVPLPTVPENAPAPILFDPTQEAAPPGLYVRAGDDPIVFLEAVAMRKELSHLLGRFSSANLSLQVAETVNTALFNKSLTDLNLRSRLDLHSSAINVALNCADPQGNCAAAAPLAVAPPPSLIQETEKILKRFPKLVADQDYALARQEWINARDTLLQRYPDSQPVQPEIRAVWLDRGTIVKAGSPEGLKPLFDRLAAAGINVVFFETLNAGYPVYPSTVAPAQNPLTVGWDPLAAAVELAHDRQMELHAWIWAFAAGNQAHNRLLGQPENYLGPVLSQHPDWINRDNRGGIWSAGKPFFDPAHPGVRQYLHSIIAEISDRYDVDGIQLDYIRYPFQDIAGGTTFGYGTAGRAHFKQRTGVDPLTLNPRHPLWETWQNFRIEQIDTFVAEVGENLRRYHPEKKLSVDVFAFPTHERLAKLQQNWEAWARRGDVDFVCLMAYAKDTNRFAQLTEPWFIPEDLGGTLILGGIHLLSLPHSSLVLDQVQFLRDHATAGYVLFATDQFSSDLQTRFRPNLDQENVLPHRQPLQAAVLRYAALQQEWTWLASQGNLALSEADQTAFEVARNRLEQALAEAARSPSPQTVERATVELEKFQAGLENWLRWYEITNRYQVRTWRHRLSVLTILLNYGERMLEQSRPIALGFEP